MTYTQAAKDALAVQNAVNLSGVVHSFADAVDAVWDEAYKIGEGIKYVNTHPIVVAFLEKLIDLNEFQTGDSVARDTAFSIVEDIASRE